MANIDVYILALKVLGCVAAPLTIFYLLEKYAIFFKSNKKKDDLEGL